MADPAPYVVSYSFGGFQSSNPAASLPGPSLDNELANAAAAIATLIASVKDVRRSDGALQNGIVTLASFAQGLQLTVDPTNGNLVAAAVATAQAAQTASSASATAAGTSATNSAASATAAAASAGSVNLSLYFPKAGNFAGVGSPDTARANLLAAKVDGSDMTGRLAPIGGFAVTDWNAVISSGFQGSSPGAANAPDATNYWLVQTLAGDATYAMQIAYPIVLGATSVSSITPVRRSSYFNGVAKAWQPWESASPVAVGSLIWTTGANVPVGYVKANGALLSRTSFSRLWTFASSSGNLTSEAAWAGGASGAYSTGDLATTFRVPDVRGEFIRGLDDGRGVDTGRVLGANQADSLKDHTHQYNQGTAGSQKPNGTGTTPYDSPTPTATGGASTGAAGETRPRNIPFIGCIKF